MWYNHRQGGAAVNFVREFACVARYCLRASAALPSKVSLSEVH
jgi:hypothetical protein